MNPSAPVENSAPLPAARSSRAKTLLVLVLIFLCGGTAGWALHSVLPPPWGGPSGMRRPPGGREEFAAHLRRRFARELSLTEAQQAALAPALDRAAGEMTEVRRSTEQRARAAIDALHAEIRPQLTEEQAKKLDEMHRRRREPPPP